MELKKLHMGTMSYSLDTMDEIQSHLASSFGQETGNIYNKSIQRKKKCINIIHLF